MAHHPNNDISGRIQACCGFIFGRVSDPIFMIIF
jgi:hypothetical protein